jgi:hypothetical protein
MAGNDDLPDIIPLGPSADLSKDYREVFDPDTGMTVRVPIGGLASRRPARTGADANVTDFGTALGDAFVRSWQGETQADLAGELAAILSKREQISKLQPLSLDETLELSKLTTSTPTPVMPSGPYMNFNSPSFQAQARIGELRARQNRDAMLAQLNADLEAKTAELKEVNDTLARHQGTTYGKAQFDKAQGFGSSLRAVANNPLDVLSQLAAESSWGSAKAAGAGMAATAATVATGGGALLAGAAGLGATGLLTGMDSYDGKLLEELIKKNPEVIKDPKGYVEAYKKNPADYEKAYREAQKLAIKVGIAEGGATAAMGGLTKLIPGGKTLTGKIASELAGEVSEEVVTAQAVNAAESKGLLSPADAFKAGVGAIAGVGTQGPIMAGVGKAGGAIADAFKPSMQVDASTLTPMAPRGNPGQMAVDLNTLSPIGSPVAQAAPQAQPQVTPQLRVNTDTLAPVGTSAQEAPAAGAELPDVIPLGAPQASTGAPAAQTSQAPQAGPQAAPQAQARTPVQPQAQQAPPVSSLFTPPQTQAQAPQTQQTQGRSGTAASDYRAPQQGRRIVMVDPKKVLDSAGQGDPGFDIRDPQNQLSNNRGPRLAQAGAFLGDQNNRGQLEASRVGLRPDGSVAIGDGRHRLLAAQQAGLSQVGVDVSDEEAAGMARFAPDQNQAQPAPQSGGVASAFQPQAQARAPISLAPAQSVKPLNQNERTQVADMKFAAEQMLRDSGLPRATGAVASGRDEGGETQDKLTGGFESGAALYITARQFEGATREQAWSEILEKFKDNKRVATQAINAKDSIFQIADSLDGLPVSKAFEKGSKLASTRFPSAVSATEDAGAYNLQSDIATVYSNPTKMRDFAKRLKKIAGFKHDPSMSDRQVIDAFMKHVEGNLLHMFDSVPPEIRGRSKLWYVGANLIAKRLSEEHGISHEAAAGVLAVLSPQMDWYKNVSLAERALDIILNKSGHAVDQKMIDAMKARNAIAKIALDLQETKAGIPKEKRTKYPDDKDKSKRANAIRKKARDAVDALGLAGQKIGEIKVARLQAIALRAYDEAYNPRSYDVITPEGGKDGPFTSLDGEDADVAWGGFGTIEKCFAIVRDQSMENISSQLGGEHKVRNFYNNIIDPEARDGQVTIDTHAVAAALMEPLSGEDPEVKDNLGGAGGTDMTGLSGLYPIYAHAYGQAAKARGVLPREMQSITWEAVRGLFPATYKSNEQNITKIKSIWSSYRDGKIDIATARSQLEAEVLRARIEFIEALHAERKIDRAEADRRIATARSYGAYGRPTWFRPDGQGAQGAGSGQDQGQLDRTQLGRDGVEPDQGATGRGPQGPQVRSERDEATWNELERKAAELDRRRAARAQAQAGNTDPAQRRRGNEQIAQKLINELRRGGSLTHEEATAALRLVEKLMENGYLDNLAVSVSQAEPGAGVRGEYNAAAELVKLFVRNTNRPGVFKHTFAHEVAHHLERMVPAKDLEAARQQFLRDRAKWLKDKKGLRELLGEGNWLDKSFSHAQLIDFAKKNDIDMSQVSRLFRRDTNTGRWRLARTDETYRLTNFSEYFADTIADLAKARDDARVNSQNMPTVFAKLKELMSQIKKALMDVFGKDKVEAIWDKFQEGAYTSDFKRDKLHGYDRTGGQNPVMDDQRTADYRASRFGDADQDRQTRVDNIDKLEPNKPIPRTRSARDDGENTPIPGGYRDAFFKAKQGAGAPEPKQIKWWTDVGHDVDADKSKQFLWAVDRQGQLQVTSVQELEDKGIGVNTDGDEDGMSSGWVRMPTHLDWEEQGGLSGLLSGPAHGRIDATGDVVRISLLQKNQSSPAIKAETRNYIKEKLAEYMGEGVDSMRGYDFTDAGPFTGPEVFSARDEEGPSIPKPSRAGSFKAFDEMVTGREIPKPEGMPYPYNLKRFTTLAPASQTARKNLAGYHLVQQGSDSGPQGRNESREFRVVSKELMPASGSPVHEYRIQFRFEPRGPGSAAGALTVLFTDEGGMNNKTPESAKIGLISELFERARQAGITDIFVSHDYAGEIDEKELGLFGHVARTEPDITFNAVGGDGYNGYKIDKKTAYSARDEEPAGKQFLDTDRLFLEVEGSVDSLYSPTAKKNLPNGARITSESLDEEYYDADSYGDPTGYSMTVIGKDGEILAEAQLVMDKDRVFTKRPKYIDGKIQRKQPKLEEGWAMTVEMITGDNPRAQVAVAAEAVERAKMAGATMVLLPFKGWDHREAVGEVIKQLEGDEDIQVNDEIDALNIVFKQKTPDYAEAEQGEAAYGIRRDQVYSARDEEPAKAPMSVEQRKARIEEIKREILPLASKGNLSREEGARYSKLGMELETHRFEMRAGRGLKLELIKPMQERGSAIPSEIVKIASDELASSRAAFDALTEASLGVRINQDTAVDVIMNGENANVSPSDLYSAFDRTREALRRQFGDTIVLYRAHGKQKQKATQNWHSTEAGAREYGSNIERREIPVDDVIAMNVGLRGAYEEFVVGKKPGSVDQDTALSARDEDQAGLEFTTPGGELTNHGDKALANGGFMTREALRIPENERSRYSFAFAPDERSGGYAAQIKYDGKPVANLDMTSEVYEDGKGLVSLDMIDVDPKFQGRGLSTILQAEVYELGKRANPPVDTAVSTVLDPKARPLKSMQKLLGKKNVDILESTTEATDEYDQFGYEGSDDDLVEMAERDGVDFYERGQKFRDRREIQGNIPQYTPEQRRLINEIQAANAAGDKAKARQLKAQFDKSVQDNDTQILSARDEDGDYRGSHRAPDGTNGEGSLDAMDRTYPEDIYGPNGARYYGARRADDVKIHKLIQSVRGKPDAMVTVYRAVPKGVATEITPGNWVTPSRDYAAEHGERFQNGFDIIERQVRAGDLFTEGNSIQEFGWNPTGESIQSARDEDVPSTGSTARKAGLAAGALALAPTTVEAATGAAKAAGATIAGVAMGDLISVASGIAFTSSDRLLKGLNPIAANMHLLANDTRSKTMKRVAEMFNRLGGNIDAGAQETYHEERDANRRIFRNKLADAFEPLAKLSQDQIRALDITIARALAGEIPMPSGPVGQVVQNLQALSDELYTYLRQSGLELNYAQGYAIPHSFNAEAVAKDEQAFIDTAEQAYIDNNPKRIRSLQKYIQQIDQEAAQNGGFTQEMSDRKNAMLEEIKKLQVANPRQQAEDLAAAILSGAEGGDQSQGLILASNPRNQNRADFLKSRVFEHSARAMLREYFHNDPRHAWNNYIARATTLAEFSRRFGADGQTWNSMVEQMRKEGVKEVDITRIKEMVLDAMGALTPAAQGSHAMANALLGLSNMSKLKSTFLTNFLEAQAQAIPGNLFSAITAPVVMLKEFAAILAELSPRQRALLKQFLRVDLNSETGNMELARITGLMDSAGVHNIMENSAYALDNKADFREDSRTDRAARKISNATGRMAQAYGIEASENAKRAMGARYAAGRLDQHVSEFLRDNILARALKKVGYKGDAMTTRNEAIMRLRRAGVNDANMIAFGTWWEKARASGKFNEMLADTTDPMAAMARKAIRMESARAMVSSNRAMKPGGERNKAISQDNFWGKAVMSFLNYPAAFREQIAKPMARDIASGFRGSESEGGQATFFSPAERARMIARASAIPAMAVSAAAFLALRVLALGDEEDKEELKKKTLLNHMIDGLSYTGLTGGKTEAVQRARRGQLPPIIDEGVRLGKNFEREATKSNGKERAITKSLTRSVAVPGTQAVVSTYAPAPIAAVVDQALASKAFNELVVDTVAGKEKEKKKASSDPRTGSRESGRSSGRSDGR